ncbi:hypothetical protein KC19_4G198700 [Ceratodon purpureus]|uniref:Uncharacterized protein n=1 Tax=Ceratodon purpureus TaxID=3225 RepID=A0A8T0ID62_CERPU|nr:hypothetical protein KC19_4G198700 [Ceratodon purpureus]
MCMHKSPLIALTTLEHLIQPTQEVWSQISRLLPYFLEDTLENEVHRYIDVHTDQDSRDQDPGCNSSIFRRPSIFAILTEDTSKVLTCSRDCQIHILKTIM